MQNSNHNCAATGSAKLAGFIVMMAGHFISTSSSMAQTSASQITAENVMAMQKKGPDAIGGIDDWHISNGTLCAVIADVEHEGEFSSKGGSVIDLGYCDRADDHFSFANDLLNGSRSRPLDAQTISIEEFNGSPSIVVQSAADGAIAVTRYHFVTDRPNQLHISKRYEPAEGEKLNFISPFHFNYHSLEPFIFNSQSPELSNGFQNEDFAQRGVSAVDKAARDADTIITVSPRSAEHGIAYGWRMANATRIEGDERTSVPVLAMADTAGTAFMLLTDTFYLGDGKRIGWAQLPQIPLLSLEPGSALETTEIIYVGNRGDVASVTDQLFDTGSVVSGSISEPDSAIHVLNRAGKPITHVRPDVSGKFEFRLPEGDYQLKIIASAGRSKDISLSVKPQSTMDLGTLELPSAAQLSLPRGEAMRLVFVGLEGTDPPDFSNELTLASVAFDDRVVTKRANSAIFLAGIDSDQKAIHIAPGNYLVYATKGPEFSLEKTRIKLGQGQTVALEIATPKRVISTPNYIASDLHVHSGLSFDNVFAETERVRTFVAEHGEVMVASEHDLPTDYAPFIASMGVADKIVSIPAAEVTSLLPTKQSPHTNGHVNFFPVTPKPERYRNGLPNHEDKRLRETLHAMQHVHPDVIAQLNHPRFDLRLSGKELPSDWQDILDNGNFLDHMGVAGHPYNPHKHLHEHPNKVLIEPDPNTGVRDIDFDLIEVINPGGPNHHDRLRAVRQDWLSFIKQGERIVGTANSDSHNALEQVGLPRTMVRITDDAVLNFNQNEFIRSLKSGDAYGTTGPMLEVDLLGTPMGGTFTGARGTLTVTITAAPWVDLERLEVQINGETVDTHELKKQLSQTIKQPLEFTQDSFVTVEVFGPANEDYSTVYPGITPYAFSNPIYVDAQQDGKWQAPGL